MSRQPRPTSAGTAGSRGGGATPAGGAEKKLAPDKAATVAGYLKVYGLSQYARAFLEAGLVDLETIGRLSESETLGFLEQLRIYPGHRLRLLRAVDCLRHAVVSAEKRDAAQEIEDDAELERLCAKNEALAQEKELSESEKLHLQGHVNELRSVIRQQDEQLRRARERVMSLQEMVESQTEQVAFLVNQLQMVAREGPSKEAQLYASYRGSFNGDANGDNGDNGDDLDADDDWGEAQVIELPDEAASGSGFQGLVRDASRMISNTQVGRGGGYRDDSTLRPSGGKGAAPSTAWGEQSKLVVPARQAQTLDSAQVRECLAGFDVDHIIKCLAVALQNEIILVVGKARPHAAPVARMTDCAIFLEPPCKEKLLQEGSSLDRTAKTATLTSGKIDHPLNGIAVRNVPDRWDIYGFLRDVMVNFRLEPEVSVITLLYVTRFAKNSGVAVTPDNWQRLTITSMMLASKVWNDESFENLEFAQLCPLYTLDEINTFERVYLKCVGYNMSVKGSEYANTYFLLRTLGAKDSPKFNLEPMHAQRATRLLERCLEKQVEFKERCGYNQNEAEVMNFTM